MTTRRFPAPIRWALTLPTPTLARSPRSLEVFLAEVEQASGADPRLDARVRGLRDQFADPETLETRARRVVEGMALCLQGSLLVRNAPPAVADAFCASRLAGDGGLEYGTLPAGTDFGAILEGLPECDAEGEDTSEQEEREAEPPQALTAPASPAALRGGPRCRHGA